MKSISLILTNRALTVLFKTQALKLKSSQNRETHKYSIHQNVCMYVDTCVCVCVCIQACIHAWTYTDVYQMYLYNT